MKAPQHLGREAIDEFRFIYKAQFGEALSEAEIQEIGLRLLRFFGILSMRQANHFSNQIVTTSAR